MYTLLLLLNSLTTASALAQGSRPSPKSSGASTLWQPKVGSKFQIILHSKYGGGGGFGRNQQQPRFAPADAEVLDLDLFDTTPATIKQLHDQGQKVICYFSAGSSETWRPDFRSFNESDKANAMRGWVGEQWLDIRSQNVFEVMKKRIQLAASKGCDGIDPDNVDAFTDELRTGGGFTVPLTRQDSINYVKKLAAEARQVGLSMGLKNAPMIIPQVRDDIQFAVNEQCATDGMGCDIYQPLLSLGKPVFHIEYVTPIISGSNLTVKSEVYRLNSLNTTEIASVLCLRSNFGRSRRLANPDTISTVIKSLDLGRFVLYCDGSFVGDT